ncbi:hypothetical protein ALT_8990 [Aspergillus lentulus]|uniref:FAD-binding PCMH-type domain-containing protein n=1 Tax=Aspergillus lentulus TaxID=293939 RepID=A0AAN4PSJ2_ASPLE|nr:hypothetical protein ALT_8990 [Aspergillus lentulus]
MKTSWALTALVALVSAKGSKCSECRCLPSDSCWPSPASWAALNSTVGGRLVATVPIGSPCHDPTYDATACAALRDAWNLPQTHIESSSSIMQTYFANQSCDPFTAESKPCTLGNYVNYAVDVSSSNDVIAAVNFARKNNIRFVIRNTGHDYFARSTGAGALSVWMHHFNDIQYRDWSDAHYKGPAFKVGAGVMGFQVMEAAHAKGLVVVGGECPTVGLAGGYIQGGGHSALSTSYGLGADNALEFQVVTAAGKLVTANRTTNPDLFWALSGGGAGNYGVVISATIKAHPDATVAGASVQFLSSKTTADNFYEAISEFHGLLPEMIDAGATVIYQVASSFFAINPVTAYNKTTDDVKALLAPFLKVLDSLSIPYAVAYTEYASYYEHYNKYMGPLPYGNLGVGEYQYGGRLIPRDVLDNNAAGFASVIRNITEHGVIAVGVGMNVSQPGDVSNAIFPAMRNAAVTMQIGTHWNETAPWSDMVADQYKMTNEYVPQLEAVTPGSGCYQNEANFRQPNWKDTFFGVNYSPLLKIKQKWDPNYFFYALKAVGSDYWTVDDSGLHGFETIRLNLIMARPDSAVLLGSGMVVPLNEYHAILHRNKYAILYFCDSHEQCASLDPTYNDMASTVADADDMIDFYKINISQHHDISDAAMVEKPTLLLVKDGRELERFCKPVPQQLEYMVSQALCGMTKISMIPYTEREGHGNLMYCIPAQK